LFRRNKEEQTTQPTYLILSPRPYYTSIMKISLLARALKTFPLPYPIPHNIVRDLSKVRTVTYQVSGVRLYTYAYYGPADIATTSILSKPLARVSSTTYVSNFMSTVLKVSSELRDLTSKVLVVLGQVPLDISYFKKLVFENTSGSFLPTPRILDKCNVVGKDDMCYEENLNGSEKMTVLVDSGLIMSLLYVFIDTPTSGLQLKLHVERVGSGEGGKTL